VQIAQKEENLEARHFNKGRGRGDYRLKED
jgi:hypothetical protein